MYITVQKVRQEIQDQVPEDNSIDCDLAFSDEEIANAMNRAAARYNSLPPKVEYKTGTQLDDDEGFFMDFIIIALYRSAINKLSRNILTWQAGGVSVDVEKTRIEAYNSIIAQLEPQALQMARVHKTEINRDMCWNLL